MNNTKAVTSPTPIRILHVDDDADFLELAGQIIKISGDFIIDGALSADEAFEKLQAQPYDIVLCDYEMQGKDSLELLRELREQKNDVAFMLFTGKGREEVAITALNLGADGYYNKHGSTETVFGELIHGIKTVTEERRTKRALAEREKHYRTLMDQAVDIIFVLEFPKEGAPVIRDANSAALKLHGYTMEELYGKPITLIDKHLNDQKILSFASDIKQGKSITFETLHKRKDGSQFYVEVTLKGMSFGSETWAIAIERDVTERRQSEEALRSSEARYKALFEQAGDYLLLMEIPEGKLPIIRDVNSSALRVLGYSKDELVGKHISVLDSSSNYERTYSLVQKLRGGKQCTFKTAHRRKDGSLIYVEALIKPVKIGADIWFISIHRDITECKRAEQALKLSEAHFRTLFDNAVDCILLFVSGDQGVPVIQDANPSALKMHGYTREELIGKPLSIIDKSISATLYKDFNTEFPTDAPKVFHVQHQRKDGSIFEVEASVMRLILDDKTVWFSFEREVINQNKTETTLRLADARFRALYDNTYDAVLILTLDGHILSANATACRMFDRNEEELKAIGREGIVVMDERVKRFIEARNLIGQAKAELTFKRGDGSTFEGDLTSTRFMESDGKVYVSAIIRDISPRKLAEEELKESSRKISVMNEKLRVVGGLTRHDVKNKLSIISANVYLLKKKLGGDSELLKYLDAISTAVTSSDKLFDFSRFYEKIGVEQLTEVDVGECFNEAVALMPNLVGVDIVNECSGLTVTADSLLRQVFYNLLDNSAKHGGKVTEIKLCCSKTDSGLKLYYTDNGVGISAENKLKLFTEGFTTGNGSGLGLRLARKMVEVYGWSIAETGEFRSGVRFEISIK
jgi:PAS domain S-box-containing protein